MSHFSVTVRLPFTIKAGILTHEVSRALIPYKEYGCGDHDPDELSRYLVFEDMEDKELENYQSGTVEMIRLRDGSLLHPWDEKFRNPDNPLRLDNTKPSYIYPETSVEVTLPFNAVYPTFDDFMTGWNGYKGRDPRTGRYGRWHNPNQKWDWWTVGGRYRGHFHVKGWSDERLYGPDKYIHIEQLASPFKVDGCRIHSLDNEWALQEQCKRMDTFWQEWQDLCNGKEDENPFYGPRSTALHLGLIQCLNEDELPEKVWKKTLWPREIIEEINRYDVFTEVTREQFDTKFRCMFWPFNTYALLDSTGWHDPGRMGWWGMSSATPESYLAFNQGFIDRLQQGDKDDWVVCVDCHI